MTIVRALDSSGNWTFGRGKNNYKQMNDAIQQNIQTRLYSFLGDCFFSVNDGMDWFNLLGSKNTVKLRLAVAACILNTDGVVSVNEISVSFDTAMRKISIGYSVNTIYTGFTFNPLVVKETSFLLTQDGQILTTEDGSGLSY